MTTAERITELEAQLAAAQKEREELKSNLVSHMDNAAKACDRLEKQILFYEQTYIRRSCYKEGVFKAADADTQASTKNGPTFVLITVRFAD